MREIPLSRGYVALVDDEDYERVNQFKWYAVGNNWYSVYAVRWRPRSDGKRGALRLHRFVLNVDDPAAQVDHKDDNGLNCQKSNLRLATVAQNAQNQGKQRGRYTSRFKGVCLNKEKQLWTARVRIDNKQHHLGYFRTEIEAAAAYDSAAVKHYREFARLNLKLGEKPCSNDC